MVGTRVLHYQIEQKLGEGGMGEVFLATDTKLDRSVALKFLPTYLSQNSEFRARFEHEARAAAALSHPQIVTIYDLLEHEGRLFIVMEAVSGESLDHLVRRRELSLSQAVDIVQQICDGLEEAHEAGIVHRDIKASNIMIDDRGRARILDFGLAKSSKAASVTKSGATVGTLAYLSPEQLSGKTADARSDLYCLGVVLYEMIAGRTPFVGDYEEALRYSIMHDSPEPLARYKSDVPDELQRIQSKLLAKDPGVRYQSAADLQADLTQLKRTSGPTLSGYLSGPAIPERGLRDKRLWWAAGIGVLAVALLMLKPWNLVTPQSTPGGSSEDRLIITYFNNLADPADTENLGEITASLLIADLSESRNLHVVSSQHLYDLNQQLGVSGQGTGRREASTAVARKAHARWMLLGSIVREQPALALSSELVEVATGNAVASQRVTAGEGDDLFTLLDKLAAEVRADLPVQKGNTLDIDPAVAKVTTSSEAAYRRYVKGLRLLYQYNVDAAVQEFRAAQTLDSNFAMADFRLATCDFLRRHGTIYSFYLKLAVRHQSQASTKEQMYIEAFRLARTGQYDDAAQMLQLVIARFPEEKEAFVFLGGLELFLRASPARACAAFTEAIHIDTAYGLAYNYLGYSYAALEDWEPAQKAMNRYIELSPGEPNPYDSRGDVYATMGELDSAIAAYRTALRIEDSLHLELPTCESCGDLGTMYLFKGEDAKAEATYRKLLSSPVTGLRHNGRLMLALVPAVRGHFREALSYLDKAIVADSLDLGRPAAADMYVLKAMIQQLRGYPDSALREINRSIELARAWQAEPYYLKRRVGYLARLGKSTEAARDLDSLEHWLLTSEPLAKYTWYTAQGLWALNQDRPADALVAFQSALAGCVNNQTEFDAARYELANAYLAAGKLDLAISLIREILSSYSTNTNSYLIYRPLLHYQLGLALEGQKANDLAAEEYRTFLAAWKTADADLPQLADARSRLGRLSP